MTDASIPTVLAILVSKDGARWLPACLASLAKQTHPRLGILAVDNASTDGSAELLERLLGPRRVLRLQRNLGFPGAVARALRLPVSLEADHVLLIHDDAVLAPDAVERMLEAAGDDVGIVGAKVLDAHEPQVLRDVGGTIDRFGYPYSPLEEGEIDHGQYDSTREVLAVSSSAMLVSREAWSRAGPPDDRLRPSHADLDFCWRVRVAGFRVVIEPGATVHHRSAGDRAERPGIRVDRGRYFDERANLTGILKNYRLFTLLWIFPLFLLQGISKVALFVLLRRFTSAWQSLAGWGWALLRLPGTVRRRARVTATRRIPDREVAKLMVPVSDRLRRWSGQISGVLFPGRAGSVLDDEAPEAPPLRSRVGGLLADHPAAVALALGLLVGVVAFRDVLFVTPLQGGSIPTFPGSARGMLGGYVDGTVPGGFGGGGGPSPAVGLLGLGSVITLGNPRILAWLLVAAAPFLAGLSAHRAVLVRTGHRTAAVVGGLCYALSAVVLWAVSEGRLESIALLVGLPWLVARLERPVDEPVGEPFRWVVGTALGLGAVAAFFPAVWAPVALVVLVTVMAGGSAGRRVVALGLALGAVATAAVLVFPLVREVVRSGADPAAGMGTTTAYSSMLRLAPGSAPGSWLPGLFLPVAGALGFAVAAGRGSRSPWRALLVGALSLPLAWLGAADWLPAPAAAPVAFLGLAAFASSALVGEGVRVVAGSGRLAFGGRQVAAAAMALLVAAGVALQVTEAVRGDWRVGRDRISPAYPVVATARPNVPFRVLWLGSQAGGAFPAPGGLPQGVVRTPSTSVRYGVTGRQGRSVFSIGLPAGGPGYEYLERGLRSVLAGRVRHGGSLLTPLGIAYVVAGVDDLPDEVRRRLDVQLDLLPEREVGGLLVYRNARAIPLAAVLPDADASGPAASSDLLAPARVSRLGLRSLRRSGPWAWAGHADLEAPALAYLASQYRPDWRLVVDGEERGPFRAFGWAVGFEIPAGRGAVRLERPRGWERTVELMALAALWGVALWIVLRRRTA
jgi:GT2 family glycosyltransferase